MFFLGATSFATRDSWFGTDLSWLSLVCGICIFSTTVQVLRQNLNWISVNLKVITPLWIWRQWTFEKNTGSKSPLKIELSFEYRWKKSYPQGGSVMQLQTFEFRESSHDLVVDVVVTCTRIDKPSSSHLHQPMSLLWQKRLLPKRTWIVFIFIRN